MHKLILAAEQSTWTESKESFFNINWLMGCVQSVENYVSIKLSLFKTKVVKIFFFHLAHIRVEAR